MQPRVKVSEEMNRDCPARNTTEQLLTPTLTVNPTMRELYSRTLTTNFSRELLTSKHMFLSHYYLQTLNIPIIC